MVLVGVLRGEAKRVFPRAGALLSRVVSVGLVTSPLRSLGQRSIGSPCISPYFPASFGETWK